MNRELLELAAELSLRHRPFVTATVVWARGPSSGKRGSTAIIQADGSVTGWIGGACAQPAVAREAREALSDGRSRLLFLGTEEDISAVNRPDVTTVPISCTSEGALEVYLEPMLPQPYLVVVGRSPAVRTMVGLAKALDWRVTVVDDGGDKSNYPNADAVLARLVMPPDIDESSAVLIATQGHYDEPALEAALETRAGYIGLIASDKRAQTILGYLQDRGAPQEQIDRVVAPAGVDLGHIGHREIGLSVLAELAQRRARGELGGTGAEVERRHTAIDPVCAMEVEVANAKWIADFEGETFYFCAPGCKAVFEKAPADFVSVG